MKTVIFSILVTIFCFSANAEEGPYDQQIERNAKIIVKKKLGFDVEAITISHPENPIFFSVNTVIDIYNDIKRSENEVFNKHGGEIEVDLREVHIATKQGMTLNCIAKARNGKMTDLRLCSIYQTRDRNDLKGTMNDIFGSHIIDDSQNPSAEEAVDSMP